MNSIIQHIVIIITLLFCTSAFAQSKIPTTPTTELYGYYQKGENAEEAKFMGREYAHRRYGPNAHSQLTNLFANPGTSNFQNGWYAGNERRSFEFVHIPAGFLHDIIDNNAYNQNNGLNDNIVVDSIQGFTIGTIFSQLDGSTQNAGSLINKLQNVIPSGVTNSTANYILLKNTYGY
ncbi:MAG: hypothetical protein ACK5NK_07800 [Niabella sp.]